MVSVTLALILHSLYLSLRLSGRGGAFPRRLTAEEEAALWQRHQQGDKRAQDALIEHNMRLVTHIARKFYASESDYEDLLSCGNIGLIKAVMTFNPDKGARFATYACRCIENEFRMQFRKEANTPKLSSLDDSLGGDDESVSLGNTISVEDDNLERVDDFDRGRKLNALVKQNLHGRELEIVQLRYGLDGVKPRTQREVAAELNISRSYVSRIEKKALERLRQCCEEIGL